MMLVDRGTHPANTALWLFARCDETSCDTVLDNVEVDGVRDAARYLRERGWKVKRAARWSDCFCPEHAKGGA